MEEEPREPRPIMHEPIINTETALFTQPGQTLPKQTSAAINVSWPTVRSRRMEQPIPPQTVQPHADNTQNELTGWIIQHQNQTSLPSRELPTFSVDLLSYLPFIKALKCRIEQKTENDQHRLYFLEQYTTTHRLSNVGK